METMIIEYLVKIGLIPLTKRGTMMSSPQTMRTIPRMMLTVSLPIALYKSLPLPLATPSIPIHTKSSPMRIFNPTSPTVLIVAFAIISPPNLNYLDTLNYTISVIKLIVFLGNPGREYKNTRHNVAFTLFDNLVENDSLSNKFHSIYAEKYGLKLIKPMTYMNLSGTAVSEAASFFKLKSEEILICHDDTELPLGKVELQKGGGLKGHKGLRNIAERLGKDDFYRIRIGIGRPKYGDMRVYVLSPFKKEEQEILENSFREAESIIRNLNR